MSDKRYEVDGKRWVPEDVRQDAAGGTGYAAELSARGLPVKK